MRFKSVLILGIVTLLFFGVGGILIIELYSERSILDEIQRGWPIPFQLIIGIVYGLISGMLCIGIINRPFFKSEKEFYQKKVSQFELNNFNIVFISLCAGIGEEIFFRAAIQPLLGVWPTAIIFVVLHGYLNPKNWRISIYGLVMVFIMAGIGYLYERIGLTTVMVAHTVIDIVLFKLLLKDNNKMETETHLR